jgi:phosphoribosylanthranilate isomerase
MVPFVPPTVASVLLTSKMTAEEILAEAAATGCNTVQIVDHIAPDHYPRLRQNKVLRFLQVVHVEDRASIALAEAYAGLADGLLLDSGRPAQAELGGTGRTHDWSLSAEIVRRVAKPVYLAGGLDASNIAEAIRQVRPFGVDLCSRIRIDGVLDEARLSAFVGAMRQV